MYHEDCMGIHRIDKIHMDPNFQSIHVEFARMMPNEYANSQLFPRQLGGIRHLAWNPSWIRRRGLSHWICGTRTRFYTTPYFKVKCWKEVWHANAKFEYFGMKMKHYYKRLDTAGVMKSSFRNTNSGMQRVTTNHYEIDFLRVRSSYWIVHQS